jgi:integrase
MFSSPIKTRLQPARGEIWRQEFRLILLWRDAYQPGGGGAGSEACGQDRQDPVIEGAEWRKLLASISATILRDLRDRALIASLTYSFARTNAALKMKVEDLRPRGIGWTVRLHEKGGKQHAMPRHHARAEALRAHIDAAGKIGFRSSSHEPGRTTVF